MAFVVHKIKIKINLKIVIATIIGTHRRELCLLSTLLIISEPNISNTFSLWVVIAETSPLSMSYLILSLPFIM